MSSRYKVYEDYKPHFITSTVIEWIDALSRPAYKESIAGFASIKLISRLQTFLPE